MIRYEVMVGKGGFYAQVHCDCGTTLGSAGYLMDAHDAIAAAQNSLEAHFADAVRAARQGCGLHRQEMDRNVGALAREYLRLHPMGGGQ